MLYTELQFRNREGVIWKSNHSEKNTRLLMLSILTMLNNCSHVYLQGY